MVLQGLGKGRRSGGWMGRREDRWLRRSYVHGRFIAKHGI
jgi:hypothetical protein